MTPGIEVAYSSKMYRERIPWLDYARASAICAVVLCHATEAVYQFKLDGIGVAGIYSQTCAFALFTIGRLGVPIFLFLSGYLMLDRQYDSAACRKFWRTKWIPLLVAAEIWLIIYNLFLCVVWDREFDFIFLLRNMLFLERVGMGHTWYIPMILGLYLFLPYIANGLKAFEKYTSLLFPLGISILILFGTPTVSAFAQCFGSAPLTCEIDPGFSGGVYGCYMLLGYCVRKRAFERIPSAIVAAAGIGAFVFVVTLQVFSYSRSVQFNVWYTNGFLLITGLSIYELLSRASGLRGNRIIYTLSYYSFAIYLVHFPVKMTLSPFFLKWGVIASQPHLVQVLSFALITMLVSLLICVLIAHVPKIGRRILYLK